VAEVDVLWLTAGLGCDGDTIAMTAATQPGIEDLVFGALPGTPRMKLYNPVFAYEVGDDFVSFFHRAARVARHERVRLE
jgi:hydrogenase small subunit